MESFLFLAPIILLIALFVMVPIFILFQHAFGEFTVDSILQLYHSLMGNLGFTLLQAGLSAFLSLLIALALAFFFAGYHWPGRRLLFALSTVPFGLPSVVVATGFILAYGRSGMMGQLLGKEYSLIYNFGAVTAAHVFFNMPFIFKRLVLAIESLPSQFLKTSKILGISRFAQFKMWIFPELLNLITSLFLATFTLCFSSFAIVLILGGGPSQSSLEVAIFEALHGNGDIAQAGMIGLLQIMVIIPILLMIRAFEKKAGRHLTKDKMGQRISGIEKFNDLPIGYRFAGYTLFFTVLVFILAPLASILIDGFAFDFSVVSEDAYRRIRIAIVNSLLLSTVVAFVTVSIAWSGARFLVKIKKSIPLLFSIVDVMIWMTMSLSPAILSTAWLHMSLFFEMNSRWQVYALLVIIQVVLIFPFVFRIIFPGIEALDSKVGKLTDSLGLSGFRKMFFVEWPELRHLLIASMFLSLSFSLGEIASILIVARGKFPTIASLIFEFMGAYRFSLGAFMAILLILPCALMSYLAQSWLSRNEVKG